MSTQTLGASWVKVGLPAPPGVHEGVVKLPVISMLA